MSFMDKLKSMFSGGSSNGDDHTGHDHDHTGHDHSHEPVAPPADPAGMPTSEPPSSETDRPA